MKHSPGMMLIALFFAVATSSAQAPDWKPVEDVFGKPGVHQGDMLKMTFPRTDLNVLIGDTKVSPDLALTGWAAFKPMKGRAMAMGDLVLLESEVPAVMSRLESGGMAITALHNHLMGESPVVLYMHFSGHGDAVKLAGVLKDALAATATPPGPPQLPPKTAAPDWSKVEITLGRQGTKKGDVLQFGIPRAKAVEEGGMEIPPFMGTANSINFQAVGSKAAITGDFVLIAGEVNRVLKALTDHGIAVTALHSHMLVETPRLFFMHFWAVDDPVKLAEGLRAALDQVAIKK